MQVLGMVLVVIGGIGLLVGGVWFLLETFRESVLWGLACMFIPFVAIFFLIGHFDRAGKPFLIHLASLVPLVIGMNILGPIPA